MTIEGRKEGRNDNGRKDNGGKEGQWRKGMIMEGRKDNGRKEGKNGNLVLSCILRSLSFFLFFRIFV